MCGIFGVLGAPEKTAVATVVEGLKRLEYRGYDSWGVAAPDSATGSEAVVRVTKQVGAIGAASTQIDLEESSVALGHTRWATHGGVTQANAHPHLARDGSFALVHNGVVENFATLKKALLDQGETGLTASDSALVVRLIEREEGVSLGERLEQVFARLVGRNAFCIVDASGAMWAIRTGSPLLIGRTSGDAPVYYVSSDAFSLSVVADQLAVVPEQTLVTIPDTTATLAWQQTDISFDASGRDPAVNAMYHEVSETPAVLRAIASQSLDSFEAVIGLLTTAERVFTIGSGTAAAAAAQVAYYLRVHAGRNATALIGGEAAEYVQFMDEQAVVLVFSQSGETADVLEILEKAAAQGATIIGHINMPASSMERLATLTIPAEAGPELAVMSTKVFTAQFVWGYVLARLYGAPASQRAAVLSELSDLLAQTADAVEALWQSREYHQRLEAVAKDLDHYQELFLLASGNLLQIAREAMIKLIEGTYLHAHAIPAGDLKHYAITLIEQGVPVLCIADDQDTTGILFNAAHEVRARGARVFGWGVSAEHEVFDVHVPVRRDSATELHEVYTIVSLQLTAYYLSKLRGINPDRPRNIAKSVTVK